MSAVAIIPARGGSRRIPRKNIKLFHGKPIIAYSIEAAKESGLFSYILVSTEDDEIIKIAAASGVGVILRPPELAEIGVPDCGTQEVTRHAIEQMCSKEWTMQSTPWDRGPAYVCCIYATAPMLYVDDIHKGYRKLISEKLDFVVSALVAPQDAGMQDAAQFYWGTADAFLCRKPLHGALTGYVQIDGNRVCDINTPEDWTKAEEMYADLHVNRDVFQGSATTGFIIKP